MKIQALVRGVQTRQRVIELKEKLFKGSHFPDVDFYETLSEDRQINWAVFYKENHNFLVKSLESAKHVYKTSGNTYDGQWLGGFRHGQGKIVFTDGAWYEG